jgi:DeoR/GlpR family transcriptional regulator of sugar metabolism
VEEAAEICGVSHDTIRRDFKKLAEEEKRRIGAYAASLIQPGETVAVDAGTTAGEAIPFLTEVATV